MTDHLPPLPQNVLDPIDRRNLIEAIKLLRAQTGLGLKEAKDLIDAHMDADVAARSEFSPDVLPASAAAALQQGNRIEATRLLHTETGIGLKEARAVVEAHAAKFRPNVAAPSPGEVPRSQGRIYWVIAAAAIIVMIVYFFLQLKR